MVTDHHQRKNLPAVLRAIESLRTQHSVDIVGEDVAGSKYQNIRWHRSIGQEQYQQLLKHANVVVYDSLYEGFGFPAQEALRQGVPVIISSAPALVETAGEFAAAIVNPLDSQALSQAIESVIEHTGPLIAAFRRSWQDVAQETMAVLQEAVDGWKAG